MTLNDLERRNSPYFAFFTEFDRLSCQRLWLDSAPLTRFSKLARYKSCNNNNNNCQADYVTVVEDRMSVKYCITVPVFYTFCENYITRTAAGFLCDSWASCTWISLIASRITLCATAERYAWQTTRSLSRWHLWWLCRDDRCEADTRRRGTDAWISTVYERRLVVRLGSRCSGSSHGEL